MTDLEVHRCDICNELLYIPERSLHTLELDREPSGRCDLDWELCSECYDKFLAWIKKRQETS